MNNREKQLREIEKYKVIEELKIALENDEKAKGDLLKSLSSQAAIAIIRAIEYLESEEK